MRHLPTIVLFLMCLTTFGQARAWPDDHKQDRQQDRQQQHMQQKDHRMDRPRNNMAPNGLNRIKQIKTAYITAKLELTPDQSARFWPMYTQYQEELFAIQKQIRQNNSPLQTNGKDQVMNELSLEDKRTGIKRRYANEFLKIMPPEKLSLLYKSEKDFNDEAVKKLRENRGDAGN